MEFVSLNIICTFVSDKCLKRNLKTIFNDKELSAKGNNNESVVHLFFKHLSNPKAVTPRTNLFLMDKEKQFVTNSTHAKVTPTQQKYIPINNLIIEYVATRLKFAHLFIKPVSKEYLAIYKQSLKPTLL